MLILVIPLDRQANNTLPVISELYHCNFSHIMHYDAKLKKLQILKEGDPISYGCFSRDLSTCLEYLNK